VTLDPCAPVSVVSDPLPPFATKFTVSDEVGLEVGTVVVTGVHCAYNVIPADNVTDCPGSYETPDPLAAVFQDVSVYPGFSTLVEVGKVTTLPTLPLSVEIEPLPPLSSMDTTIVGFTVYCA
jgi:hypothetical protein